MSVTQLTKKQAKALGALLSCPSIAAAAKACGLGERTLHRYLADPVFVSCYQESRKQQVQEAVCAVQRIATKAATTLESIVDDPLMKGSARVSACKTILECALKTSDLGVKADGRIGAPASETPTLDLSRLTPDEWSIFKELYRKCRACGDTTPPLTQPMLAFKQSPPNKGEPNDC